MIQVNDIVIYNNAKHHVLYVTRSGHCKVKKLENPKYIELVHRKDLKPYKEAKI